MGHEYLYQEEKEKHMSVKVSPLEREFRFGTVILPDPNPALSVDEVKTTYAAQYPEIVTAVTTGPEMIGSKQVYHFARSAGVKG